MQLVNSVQLDANDQHLRDLVFNTLIENNGNIALAAEQICKKLELPYTLASSVRAAIPRMISDRLDELKKHMAAVATLELFSMLPQLNKTLVENLTRLDPSDAVNAYMKLQDLIYKTTDPHELHVDHRWQTVPRELQDIYTQLEAEGKLDMVLAGEVA